MVSQSCNVGTESPPHTQKDPQPHFHGSSNPCSQKGLFLRGKVGLSSLCCPRGVLEEQGVGAALWETA